MKLGKDKLINGVIHGGAAFGGGYISGMIEEKLPIDDPKMRPIATGVLGLVLTIVDPKGPIGAAGAGIIGGAGRATYDAPDAPEGGDSVRGPRNRRDRVRRFRAALQDRGMNGNGQKYRTVTGMPDDRTVITGPGQPGANYAGKNRF